MRNEHCRRCKLSRTTNGHICVEGKGSRRAGIMLVGEAPGEAEAKTGRPFCGRSGQLLDKILREAGLDPDRDVFITNAVRCRPPGNRTPSKLEIGKCRQYLIEEIHDVDPAVIVLLGRTAIDSWEFGASISAGTKPLCGYWLVPTWHPAYCLRRGKNAVNDLRKALIKAKSILEGAKQ